MQKPLLKFIVEYTLSYVIGQISAIIVVNCSETIAQFTRLIFSIPRVFDCTFLGRDEIIWEYNEKLWRFPDARQYHWYLKLLSWKVFRSHTTQLPEPDLRLYRH